MPPWKNRIRFDHFWTNYQWLLKHLPTKPDRKWRVLEVGVGKYGWADIYSNFFDIVFMADIKDYSKDHPGALSFVADFNDPLPVREESIDMIVCHSTLEHVENYLTTLMGCDRALRVGGYIYITISPLYYSARGSHIAKLENWEHLDPKSDYYLLDNACEHRNSPIDHHLNKMTFSEFLRDVGKFPWSVIRSEVKINPNPIPNHVDTERYSEMDLRTREFLFLARKEWHCKWRNSSSEPNHNIL